MKAAILKRIEKIMELNELSQRKFAARIGVAQTTISNIFVRGSEPSIAVAVAILNSFGDISPEWLITGNGSMLKQDVAVRQGESVAAVPDAVLVPLLPVSARGGAFDNFLTSVSEYECERVISPVAGAEIAIPVAGDSMEPECPSGSVLHIKRVNERAFIEWGKTYVLDTCNGAVVKKIYPADDGDKSKIKCVSVNSKYPPFEVSLEDVYGVYQVLLCMIIR